MLIDTCCLTTKWNSTLMTHIVLFTILLIYTYNHLYFLFTNNYIPLLKLSLYLYVKFIYGIYTYFALCKYHFVVILKNYLKELKNISNSQIYRSRHVRLGSWSGFFEVTQNRKILIHFPSKHLVLRLRESMSTKIFRKL